MCDREDLGDYNVGLRWTSFFVIIISSAAGSAIPFLRIKHVILSRMVDMGNLFGVGVMLTLGFVHLFIPAMESLTDDCLTNESINPDYPAWAGVFAIIGVVILVICQHLVASSTMPAKHVDAEAGGALLASGHSHGGAIDAWSDMSEKTVVEKWVMIVALELGTALHSIAVGLALGVASEDEFTPLFIALVFHQMFEGLAIATRIADPDVKVNKLTAAGLVMFYSFTTPLGTAIGIGIHSSFNSSSSQALLTTGIIDGISAGFVLYSAIFMVHDAFLSNKFLKETPAWRTVSFLSFLTGAALMSFIGKYA